MKTIRTIMVKIFFIYRSQQILRFTILFVLLFSGSFCSIAQIGTLTGKLTDEKNNPLDFANIAVLKAADSSFVAGAMTDGEGRFSILTPVTGSYLMRYTFIGFIEIYSDRFTISANDSKNFGTIVLKQDPKTLKDVTVKTQRPQIIQMADKLVVNVQGTALAAGSTAFDVLARSPGVFVDHEGNIQLNGRSGVTVMIDGRRTYLSARELKTMFEGMSAENIKNIELITNPSAKFDAEGSSGILNINLKKNTQQGINGSVYAGYTYNGHDHGYSTGGNINHKSGKWSSFMSLDMARRVGGREATFTRIFYAPQQTTYFDQVAEGNFHVQGPPAIRLGTDYSVNDKHSIGFVFNYMTSKSWQDFLTETYIGNTANNPTQFIDADNISANRFRNLTSNLHYTAKLDTLGSSISTDLDFVQIRFNSVADFYNHYKQLNTGQVTKDFLHTDIPSGFDIYSGKVDYSKTLTKNRKLEGGVKASSVTSDNDSRFYFNNNGLVLDPSRTNHFNYKEKIFAGYVNFSGNLGRRATLQLGLRAENTRSIGNSLTTGQVTRRNYTSLFPSLFITQKINENYGITWSYSRRLQRPNYGNLNPFRFYRDPYTYVEGNPYLRPQYAHAFSVTQTIKKLYTLIVSYQLNKDYMAELPRLDVANATTIYYTGNVDGNFNAGVTAIAPLRIAKFWDSQNTMVVSFNHFEIEVDKNELVNEQLYYMLQSNHTIRLPKEFRMELTLLYQGPAAFGLYQIAPRGRVDLGFKKTVLKKLDISLNAIDIFKTQRLKFKTDINGNINDFDQYLRARYFGLTLRYNFSKGQKVDLKKRNNNLEELNRAQG